MKAKKKKVAPKVAAINCECGGQLLPVMLESFDFSGYTGFPIVINGLPGFKCSKCSGETVAGGILHLVFKLAVVEIAKLPRRLSGDEARLLRRVLSITQQELATRMAITRETVAKWECGDQEISPQNDFILRIVVITPLVGQDPSLISKAEWMELVSKLQSARTAPPAAMPVMDFGKYQSTLSKHQSALSKRRSAWPAHGEHSGPDRIAL